MTEHDQNEDFWDLLDQEVNLVRDNHTNPRTRKIYKYQN